MSAEILPQKVYLDWARPLLHQVADWLLDKENFPTAPNLENAVVIVQGSRAARRLEQLLAQKALQNRQILVPPRVLTLKDAPAALFAPVPAVKPPAHPVLVQFAWALAIEQVASEVLIGNRDHGSFASSRLAMAEILRSVCAEIRGHSLLPQEVAPRVLELEGSEETADQWNAIQESYANYLQILDRFGFSDPVERRIAYLQKGVPKPGIQLVLAGVPQLERIYSQGFNRLGKKATVLVFAPDSKSHNFGPWGEVNGNWTLEPLPLNESQIVPAPDSDSQASLVSGWMQAQQTGGIGQPQCILIAPDEAEVPGLCDALQETGLSGRPSAWKKFNRTRPWKVLQLIADYLDRTPGAPPSFQSVADLVRHPDLSRLLKSSGAVSLLDRLHGQHLPGVFSPESYPQKPMEELLGLASRIAGELGLGPGTLPAREVASSTAQLLLRIYENQRVDDHSPEGRLLRLPLEFLMEALEECRALDCSIRPTDFLRALLGSGGSNPVPTSADAGSLDIIGWLELLADDSPYAAVTSFCEGLIPDSVSADPFLPAALRARLNLSSNELRLARDAYVAIAAIRSRAGRLLVCPLQRNANGDPLRPSRLLFQGLKDETLAQRMLMVVSERKGVVKTASAPPEHPLALKRLEPIGIPGNKLSVTHFGNYLCSPRHFYHVRLLGLKLPVDNAKEIDNAIAGTLLHLVFDAFGKAPEIRDATDPKLIHQWLLPTFDKLWSDRFAGLEMATVALQRDLFEAKLFAFANEQARQASDGWRIRATELKLNRLLDCTDPSGNPVTLEVHGQIDRIDQNPETNEWRIVDYKTGTAHSPKEKHLSGVNEAKLQDWEFALSEDQKQRWTDLQFPLYDWLLKGNSLPELELLGWQSNTPAEHYYFQLPDEVEKIKISDPFPGEMLEEGVAIAQRVASHILAGHFPECPSKLTYEDPVIRCLSGVSSVVAGNGEEESAE